MKSLSFYFYFESISICPIIHLNPAGLWQAGASFWRLSERQGEGVSPLQRHLWLNHIRNTSSQDIFGVISEIMK